MDEHDKRIEEFREFCRECHTSSRECHPIYDEAGFIIGVTSPAGVDIFYDGKDAGDASPKGFT
jgi:hypothetical protein